MAQLKGTFITLEGGEGCGKTTQSKLLFKALNEHGIPTLHTREPGGTDGAEAIRHLVVEGETGRWDRITETLLYFAARRDHVEKLIRPSLERGEWVICDRFTDSTVAYQGYGHGVSIDLIKGLHRLTLGSFFPEVTFILDIDEAKGIERAHNREAKQGAPVEDRYERMGSVFHKNVRRGFLEIAKLDRERYVSISADQNIKSVHHAIVSQLNFHLKTTVVPLNDKQIDAVLQKKT